MEAGKPFYFFACAALCIFTLHYYVLLFCHIQFFVLCTGAVGASWIKKQLPTDSRVLIQDLTAGMCGLSILGGQANEIMDILDPLFEIGTWEIGQAKELFIKNVQVLAVYDSYAGLKRWEFYTSMDQALPLWDELFEAGRRHQLIAAGDRALENLRIESLIPRSCKDFWSEHDPYEAGLEHMVDMTKSAFLGKKALLERKAQGAKLVLTPLLLDDPSTVVMGHEPVFDGDKAAGFVTSAGFDYSKGKGIMYALLSPESAESHVLSVEYFGQRLSAKMLTETAVTTQ
ncbi:glycine cleavage system T protein [Scopulibacillus darangshiensis]|uniref:Glycine cleavage system T protein n=1 Tax=Scopulibacillus darangshiensis TaxID=442528 RepID=A0A4R2NH79_9BACL|nr:glycine cleavage system T protein [Scopulibacillus darangshiensis]